MTYSLNDPLFISYKKIFREIKYFIEKKFMEHKNNKFFKKGDKDVCLL